MGSRVRTVGTTNGHQRSLLAADSDARQARGPHSLAEASSRRLLKLFRLSPHRSNLDASTLAELDALRTKGGEYARHLIQTPYGSAWMYVYQRPVEGFTLIENGNWLDRDQY